MTVIRTYDVFEVFYSREGKRLSKLFSSVRDARGFKAQLKKNRRKYLGRRKVILKELV